MSREHTDQILAFVRTERERQDAKWGPVSHDRARWLAILMEEVGEAAKAYLDNDMVHFGEEMVQVAAVAVSILEDHQFGMAGLDFADGEE